MYRGSLCDINLPIKSPSRKKASKKANYQRGLIYFKFPPNTLLFLEDALALDKEIKSLEGVKNPLYVQKKVILQMQLRAVLDKLCPKFLIRTQKKRDLELAIRLYKAIQARDTLGLRKKYFDIIASR